MMQGAGILQRDADQGPLRGIGRFADRLGNFAGLAVAEANAPALIANHDESRKTETPAALHHLGHTIDVDQLVDKLAVALFAITAVVSAFTRHVPFLPLEFEAALAGGVRERLHAPMIDVAAAVEDHLLHALGDGALGDGLAHGLGSLQVP